MSMLRALTSQPMNPKTPPSTPFLEKGPHSHFKKVNKNVYGAGHRHSAQCSSLVYTRFLHVVIVLLLCCLVGLWRLHNYPGSTFPLPWSADDASYSDYDKTIIQQLRSCNLDIPEDETLCLQKTNNILAPINPPQLSPPTSPHGLSRLPLPPDQPAEKQAWNELREGLENLWKGLVDSQCSCLNAEALDRTYEGLRERARWMGTGEVRED